MNNQVGDGLPRIAGEMLLRVRSSACALILPVAHSAAVAGQVVTVNPLRRFHHLEGLLRRHHRAPGRPAEGG